MLDIYSMGVVGVKWGVWGSYMFMNVIGNGEVGLSDNCQSQAYITNMA